MKYDFKTIRESLPQEKNVNDSMWVRYFVRKISFLFTYVFLNFGFSAWVISFISALVAIVSAVLLSLDSSSARWIGIGLIHFWMILDCVDGNIARVKKTTGSKGEFMDALSGYIMISLSLFALGIAAYRNPAIFSSNREIYLLMGSLAAIFTVLTRLIYQKYSISILKMQFQNNENKLDVKNDIKNNKINKIKNTFSKELGLSGLFMVLVLFAEPFNIYSYIVIFYFLFYFISFCLIFLYLSLKAR
jgi:phosphatidylglycerophosphate synthase